MEKLAKQIPIADLIAELDNHMVEIGYAESTMSNFRECWRALKNHANNNGIEYLTKDVGFQLLKDHYGIDPQQFTRAGIAYILKKYVDIARTETPDIIPDKSSPHCMRHSKAMHLLQAGVAIIYIRDFLGHCSINTTEVYARSDEKMKREALEKAYNNAIVPNSKEIELWNDDEILMDFLTGLCKR